MARRTCGCAVLALLGLVPALARPATQEGGGAPDARGPGAGASSPSRAGRIAADALGRLPLAFVENRGQWAPEARFVVRGGGMTARLEEGALALGLERRDEEGERRGVVLRLVFEGVGGPATLEGEERQPGTHNFFLGNDPEGWRVGVPAYASVLSRGLYEGIDLRVREEGGRLEYDLLLAPGADPSQVSVRCEGALGIEVEPEGSLSVETALGPIRQTRPNTWAVLPDGARRPLDCRYRKIGARRFGFEVSGLDPGLPLVIDPGLEWSTFLGGSANDGVYGLQLDTFGNVVVGGITDSANFPATAGAYDTTPDGLDDGFVACISPDGSTLFWASYLGGSAADRIFDLALDSSNNVTVGGLTGSTNFPTTTGCFDPSFNGIGGYDGFVTRLNATGSALLFSTFLGGTNAEDFVLALAVSPGGETTVAGYTGSFTTFPTTAGAYDTTFNGGMRDGFVTRFDPAGATLVYSTFVGGFGDEGSGVIMPFPVNQRVIGLAVSASGDATVGFWTGSANYPVTPGAYDTTANALNDVGVTRLNAGGTALVWSTFLGGSSGEGPNALAVDPSGAATVGGFTYSTNFPFTPGAFGTTQGGAPTFNDAFLARLDATGSALLYSTFLGSAGSQFESVVDLAVESSGSIVAAGFTGTAGFPTTPGAFQTAITGVQEPFVLRLAPNGNGPADLLYSTYFPTPGSFGIGLSLGLDGAAAATVGGLTQAPGFPTTPGAYATGQSGGQDGFVTRIDLLPIGAAEYGASSPGCAGPLAIGVNSWPQVGNAAFAITCTNAPSGGGGLLILCGGASIPPVPILGVDVWVDLATFVVPFGVTANPLGAAQVGIQIPSDPTLVGGQVWSQFFWFGPNAPPPCPPLGFSASNALEITVQ